PAIAPIAIAAIGPTKPAAGVMPTSPATRPEATPSMVTLPMRSCSIRPHDRAPAAAATCVLTKASDASPPDASAEPALKPNHPNPREKGEVETPDEAAHRRSERERVAHEHPLQRDETQREEAVHEGRQHVLRLHHPAVEEGESGHHQHDERRGDEKPCGVAGI